MSSMGNVTLVLLASNVRSTNAHANPSAAEALEASDALISVALVSVGVASSGGSHPADWGVGEGHVGLQITRTIVIRAP